MSLYRTFSIVSKSITDSPTVIAASFEHSMFSHKCTSASLDCPYNTIQTEQPIRPPAPPPYKESPTPPVWQWPGKLSGLNETIFF